MRNIPRGILQDYERFVSSGVAPAAGRSRLKRFKSLAGPECQIQTDFWLPHGKKVISGRKFTIGFSLQRFAYFE